ncbi:hypothetical protein [Streptomyces sp. NBC_01006]|uniref:hypothetical protein n=1 Tax=Streptomyces sp. NBC_01006 TaxID=2903716 RepID=UPI0038683E53|nr:hypothetical protein OG509_23940 [Streptomyces sp. NBC_01006]
MLQNTLARMRKRYETNGTRDRGQTAFEYLGIILVVVVIIGAIVGTGIGQTITNRIAAAVTAVTAGK